MIRIPFQLTFILLQFLIPVELMFRNPCFSSTSPIFLPQGQLPLRHERLNRIRTMSYRQIRDKKLQRFRNHSRRDSRTFSLSFRFLRFSSSSTFSSIPCEYVSSMIYESLWDALSPWNPPIPVLINCELTLPSLNLLYRSTKLPYAENEKALCFHGPLMYEAKVCSLPIPFALIRFAFRSLTFPPLPRWSFLARWIRF